jgi:hypothetical protein
MSLDWLVRDNEVKDHQLFGDEHFGTEPPCTMYEKKPLFNPATGEATTKLRITSFLEMNTLAQSRHAPCMRRNLSLTLLQGKPWRG